MNKHKYNLQELLAPEGWLERHPHIQASRGHQQGLQDNLALAGLGQGPLDTPAEPLRAAKKYKGYEDLNSDKIILENR